MALFGVRYRLTRGEHGLYRIEVTGRCYPSDVSTVESGVTTRYELVPLPMARGAVLKALDGTFPSVHYITPPTGSRAYKTVKVVGELTPFAATQPSGGTHAGHTIHQFRIVYQQVGTP